ncbi:MFS transporter [Actinoplanes sp. NPDC051411]|uniref:MFS transporter n=1 Tax=Actinoplanes sp. NPDC051411 TaxID=3155522 RepID=UPI00341AC28B
MDVTPPPAVPVTRPHRLLRPPGPQRVLALATFVNTLGSGLYLTGSALYFTQVVGLPTGQYATGLTAGSALGVAAGLLVGRVADRVGARNTQIAVMLFGVLGMATAALVSDLWQFVLAAAMVGATTAASASVQAAIVRGLASDDPIEFRAYLRSLTNLAIALGTLLGGAAVAVGTKPAYLLLIGGRAAGYLGCALLLTRLPHIVLRAVPGRDTGKWQALRDRPYLTATTLNALFSLHFAVPGVLFPLWIAEHTTAPAWLISGVLLINTAIVVLLQVRASRGVDDPRAAGDRMRWAGAAVGLSLALIACSSGVARPTAVVVLLVAAAVYTVGELWHAAASMEYSYGLAAPHAQGQYSGVFGIGTSAAQSLAPTVVVALAIRTGAPGLLVLAVLFLLLGLAFRPLIGAALSREPATA